MKHDKELVRLRFARHLRSYDVLAEVQRRIADTLAAELERQPERNKAAFGIEIGAGTGFLTTPLLRLYPSARWLVNDLVPRSREFLPGDPRIGFVAGDGETLPLTDPGRPDVIATASTVQWFDDLPGFIARAAEALTPRGLLAIATFGPRNLHEITATTGQGLEYHTLSELQQFFTQNGLEPVTAREWSEELRFDTPLEVLHHLRLTGVNAVSAVRWTPSRLRAFEQEYRTRFARPETEKNIPLTFHPLIVVGKKR